MRKDCGADGQEHHDAQGHQETSGKQPSSRETEVSFSGHVGFGFMKEDLIMIRDILLANKVPAGAPAGYPSV